MITWRYRYERSSTEGELPQSVMEVNIKLRDVSRGKNSTYGQRLFSEFPGIICRQGYTVSSFSNDAAFSKYAIDENGKRTLITLAILDPVFSRSRLARDLHFRAEGFVRPEKFIDMEKLNRNLAGKKI